MSVRYRVSGRHAFRSQQSQPDDQRGGDILLIGDPACGKSTLAFSLMRLLMNGTEEITGSAMLDGVDLLKISEKEMESVRGKKIGHDLSKSAGFAQPRIRSGTQVNEAIMLDGVGRSEATARTIGLSKDLKIPDAERRVSSFPHELSGGMRQRVMIAMMLSRHPRLLIADEPTTALDVTIEKQILEIFQKLKHEKQMSFLIITHNFGIVAEIADRVGVLYAGELVERRRLHAVPGPPASLHAGADAHAAPHLQERRPPGGRSAASCRGSSAESTGCRFANRCKYCTPRCKSDEAQMVELEKGHFVKCHKWWTQMAETMIEVGKLSRPIPPAAFSRKTRRSSGRWMMSPSTWKKGKILGVVGESGSGKTTLANVILKLTKATSGHVKINGIDVEHAGRSDMKKLRRNIAVVFQDPMANLNPRFTVAKSIMRPCSSRTCRARRRASALKRSWIW